jgi:signal transduction histidine kinase
MIVRRIGLVLALLIALAALPGALDIQADPSTGAIGPLAVVVAVATVVVALTTLALLVPAWRGNRSAATIIASLQLVGILTSLPAFFAPASIVPPGAVVIASVGAIVETAVFAMIVFEVPNLVLHAAAVVMAVALYAGLVALTTSFAPQAMQRLTQTVVAVAVAISYGPILGLLRRTIGRALYGGRLDPAGTAVRLGRHTGEDPLQAAVDDAARSLRLPRIELCDDGQVLASGTAQVRASTAAPVEVPLPDSDLELRVTLRAGERGLHPDDRAALALVSVPLGLLARESALLGEIRSARAEVADVREREQLALHRDLHDGLGPLLTGAAMRADAARNLLADESAGARAELDAARGDLRSAIAEVRRVVYGLWPVELEQHGLWKAVAARAGRSGIAVRLPADPPPIPPAVELAAYRITSEALTNIDRHGAGGGTLIVDAVSGALQITVDSAATGSAGRDEGVGLRSIRVRAEELGGRAEAGPTEGGWRVSAILPVPTI